MPIRTSYYADVIVPGALDALAHRYCEWALGVGRYESARARRLVSGVEPSWKVDDIFAGTTREGRDDARLDSRADDERFLLRMAHRDDRQAHVLWHSVTELERAADGEVRVRCGVGRSAPDSSRLPALTSSPRVITELIQEAGTAARPRDVGRERAMLLLPGDVGATLRHLVFDAARELPLVVITPRNASACFPVDPHDAAAQLLGMARVIKVMNPRAAYAWSEWLADEGVDRLFRVYDGAVRVFFPGAAPGDDPTRHRLWLAGAFRPDSIVGEIGELLAQRALPPGFFRRVEGFDRAEALARARKAGTAQTASPEVAALQVEVMRLTHEVDVAETEAFEALELVQVAEEERGRAEQALEAAQAELWSAQQQVETLRKALAARGGNGNGSSVALEAHVRGGLASLIAGAQPTPRQALAIALALHPERLRVLPSALASAEGAADFRYGGWLVDALCKLSTDYVDALLTGGGDAQARQVFGKKFAPSDSEGAMNNGRAQRERTFDDEGVARVMWRHLKYGVTDNTRDSIRVHFDWAANERRVIIGHCGRHLYIPSFGK